jgi:hypothetical protein
LTEALVETQAVDGDSAENGPELRGVIALAPTSLATVRAGALRLKKGSHLLRNDDLLERLEHGFAFGKREA